MAVGHAFRVAGGAACVTERGRSVFVHPRPAAGSGGVGVCQQFGVPVHTHGLGRGERLVADDDDVGDARGAVDDPPQLRREGAIHNDHSIAGVLDDVSDLVVGQTQVERVYDGSHGRDREVCREVGGTVPAQCGDHVARTDADPRERTSKPVDLVAELAERGLDGPLVSAVVDDLGARVHPPTVLENLRDTELNYLHGAVHVTPW